MKKYKLLFVLGHFCCAGAQKSLLNLFSCLDFDKYDVDLLLFEHVGEYLSLIPPEVRLLPEPKGLRDAGGSLGKFFLSQFKKGRPDIALSRLNAAVRRRLFPQKRMNHFQESWGFMRKLLPPLEGSYDIAVSYMQGWCNYYVAEKVTARRKIGWMHTDYDAVHFDPAFDRPYFEKLHAVVGVSPIITEKLRSHFPDIQDKFHIIYNIIPYSLTRKLAEEPGGFPDPEFQGTRLLTIGRFHPLKGYDMAAQACAELIRRGHDVRWYILGQGGYEGWVREQIAQEQMEDRFFLLGTTINPYPYLKQCDIYVQPSRYEGCSMVLTEAKVLERPCVATCYDSVGDQITDGETGLIVEMNGHALAEGIERLITDRALRTRVTENLKDFRGTESEFLKYDELFAGGFPKRITFEIGEGIR